MYRVATFHMFSLTTRLCVRFTTSIQCTGAGGNPSLILVNAAHPTIDGGIAYGYEGILYAVARGADVINCSWRTARFVRNQIFDAPYSEFEALVLRIARESGSLVVAATGNDFGDGLWTTPAGYEDVLSVTSTLRDAPVLLESGNVAPWVDVAAPGQGNHYAPRAGSVLSKDRHFGLSCRHSFNYRLCAYRHRQH